MAADLMLYTLPNTPTVRAAAQHYQDAARAAAYAERAWQEHDDSKAAPHITRALATAFIDSQADMQDARDALRALATDAMTVGECSFGKASMLDDWDKWVPSAVENVARIVSEDRAHLITPNLRTQIMVGMNVPNRSWYSKHGWGREGVTPRRRVKRFLTAHMGDLVFVSLD